MRLRTAPAALAALLNLAGITAWADWPLSPLPPGTRADRLLVRKSARVLELYRGAELLRSYEVSLGRAPEGPKREAGDGRTPEGVYRLDYRKADSSFHRALHISYPRPDDIAAARARGAAAGGLVMLHGMKNHLGRIGRAHRLLDWTDGCVAVTDDEIEEIWRVVPEGASIIIEP